MAMDADASALDAVTVMPLVTLVNTTASAVFELVLKDASADWPDAVTVMKSPKVTSPLMVTPAEDPPFPPVASPETSTLTALIVREPLELMVALASADPPEASTPRVVMVPDALFSVKLAEESLAEAWTRTAALPSARNAA